MDKWKCLLLCCLCQIGLAGQLVPVHDYQTTPVEIANDGLTQIVVKGDRIRQVRGMAGRYVLQLDNRVGSVFIKPSTLFFVGGFTVFIATEHGHNLVLHCLPRNKPSGSVVLQIQTQTQSQKKMVHKSRVALNQESVSLGEHDRSLKVQKTHISKRIDLANAKNFRATLGRVQVTHE